MIRGLFWKILLAFWLSSSLIVISGGLITALEFAHERARWSQSKVIEKRALKMINRWEANRKFRAEQAHRRQHIEISGRLISRQEKNAQERLRRAEKHLWKKRPPLLIRVADTNKVLWGELRLIKHPHTETVEVESISGKRYLLSYPVPRRINALPVALKQLFSLRLLAALVLSSLFSLILSLFLTRPINRLKQHIDQMAEGKLDLELEQQLTQRRDEIGSLACSFETMSKRLSEMLESKQKLLNDVSHELRAPLARLQVAAAIIEESPNDPLEQAKLTDRIQLECLRLDHLIGQILDYSKLDQSSQQVRGPIELKLEVEAAINDGRFLAPDRQFKLEYKLPEGLQIEAVSSRINQILENLISNSIKYGLGDIEIHLQQDSSQRVQLSVRDHGQGFEEDAIASLIQPFTRGHQTADHIQGFGLGLSIVQKACELERAKLSLQNHPGGGALAIVTFNSDEAVN